MIIWSSCCQRFGSFMLDSTFSMISLETFEPWFRRRVDSTRGLLRAGTVMLLPSGLADRLRLDVGAVGGGRPSPVARSRRPTLLMGNGKGVAIRFLGGTCPF